MIAQLNRGRIASIVSLSLPTVAILLAQHLASLMTIAFVSELGTAALAGLGIASAMFSALMALMFGIDTGVQALVAQRIGAGQRAAAASVLHDGFIIALLAGPLLIAVGYAAGPGVMHRLVRDPAVVMHGLSYFNAALPMLLWLGASFAFSAYRNGSGTPRYSLAVTIVQLPCSVLLGYGLIFGVGGLPRLGTAGAGLGATLASVVGLAVHLALALRVSPIEGLWPLRASRRGVNAILAIGLPIGLQQSLVYVGTAIFLAVIGLFGTRGIAAMNVVLAVTVLAILAAAGTGIAAATLVGTALGRGDVADAKQWGWDVASVGAAAILLFSVIVIAAPRQTLGLLVADGNTVAVATVPLVLFAVGMSVDAFGRILGFAMRGAGATRLVTIISFVLQWAAMLPLCWLVGLRLGYGLAGVAATRLALIAVETTTITWLWHSGFWSRKYAAVPAPAVPAPQNASV